MYSARPTSPFTCMSRRDGAERSVGAVEPADGDLTFHPFLSPVLHHLLPVLVVLHMFYVSSCVLVYFVYKSSSVAAVQRPLRVWWIYYSVSGGLCGGFFRVCSKLDQIY